MSQARLLPAAPPVTDDAGPRFLLVRLSLLMFLCYAVIGAWFPVFSLYLKEKLAFAPEAVAWSCATNALGALVAPLLWGQIADRWLAAELCLSLCSFAVVGVLLALAHVTTPLAMFALSIIYWLFMMGIVTLSAALTFRQLVHPERHYGRVRLWGTVGWVASCWLLSLWLSLEALKSGFAPDLADSLRLGALFALALGLYSLTLPHTPPAHQAHARHALDAPLRALALLKRPSFAVYCSCLFGTYITMTFTTQMNPLLLRHLGISDSLVPVVLTVAQSSEILMLAVLPWLLAHFAQKTIMVAGIVAWTAGLLALSFGHPVALVLTSFFTHGVFICCFLVAGQVFVNRQAGHDIRASAQGLLQLFSGLGLLGGHLLVGWIRDCTADDFHLAYAPAVAIAASLACLFTISFSIPTPSVERP